MAGAETTQHGESARGSAPHGAEPGVPAPADDRVRATTWTQRLLSRPSLGSVAGALAVYLFFTLYTSQFSTTGGIATWQIGRAHV